MQEIAAAPAARTTALDVTTDGALRGSERFTIKRCLGRGGFGTVYEAYDHERCADVALKILHRSEPGALYRFKLEFRAACELHHPGLVQLHELFADGDRWFFTMELVRGKDVVEHLRGARGPAEQDDSSDPRRSTLDPAGATWRAPLSPEEPSRRAPPLGPTCEVMIALCEALRALHATGKIHRDIKPQNVLATAEGRVVLLDFGLLRDVTHDPAACSDVAGTPDYMSPEQAAGLPLTPASDLYSVGSLLFEVLTGTPPFTGPIGLVMTRKQREDGPTPGTRCAELPAELDALCGALLRVRPEERPELDDVIARLARLRGEPARVPARSTQPSAALIGREPHLDTLRAAFEESGEGRAVAVLCHGTSGIGKSTLCRTFLRDLERRQPHVVVLSGQCFEQEQIPFKAVDGVVDALSRHLRRLPPSEAAALLPRDAFALRRVFPVLDQVPAIRSAPERPRADPQYVQRAAFGALRELFQRLADRRRLVLHVDDLQWSDLDSVAVFVEMLLPPDAPSLLLCATCRDDDDNAPLVAALRALGSEGALAVHDLRVAELSPDEARSLARSLLPAADEALVGRVAEESRGNPFHLRELVTHAESGGVPTIEQAIARRVARLPARARRLLELVCVAGQPLPRAAALAALAATLDADATASIGPRAPSEPSTADRATDLSEPGAVATLRAERLVRARTGPSGEQLVAYHDRVRESVVRMLAPETLRAHHLDLAGALELRSNAPTAEPERLMKHLAAGGEPSRAARYARAAAAQAHAALAFTRSARLYEHALALGGLSPAEARAIRPALADAYAAAGRLRDAARVYQEAASEAEGEEALGFTRLAMEQLVLGRDLAAGMALATRQLERAKISLPARPWQLVLALLFARLRLGLRGLGFRERPESEVPGALLARIDITAPIATALGLLDPLRGAYLFTIHLLDTLRAGERNRLANALGIEAYLRAAAGRHASAAELMARTKALCAKGVTDEVEALSEMGAGGIALEAGDFREALVRMRAAGRRLREELPGKHWAADMARMSEIRALWMLGELRVLEALIPEVLRDAADRGSLLLAAIARFCEGYVGLCQGRPRVAEEAVRVLRDRPAEEPLRDHTIELELSVVTALHAGRRAEAIAIVESRSPELNDARLRQAQQQRIVAVTLHTTAALLRHDLEPSSSRLRAALREARRLRREAVPHARALHLLFEGLAKKRGGAGREAEAALAAAHAAFARGGMKLYAACAQIRHGEVLSGREGARLVTEAETWMSTQGIPEPARVCAILAP